MGGRQPDAYQRDEPHSGAPDVGIIGPVAAGCLGALTGDQTAVESLRATLERSRNVLLEQLRSLPEARVTKPDGTFYCLVDFSHWEADSMRLAQYLIEEARVVTIPGVAFGLDGTYGSVFAAQSRRSSRVSRASQKRWPHIPPASTLAEQQADVQTREREAGIRL